MLININLWDWWLSLFKWSFHNSYIITHKRGVPDTTLCNKVSQWLAAGWWFSPGTPVSSANKTDRHDIIEILLKVALNTINKNPTSFHNTYIITRKRVVSVLFSSITTHWFFTMEKYVNIYYRHLVKYLCIITEKTVTYDNICTITQ